MFKKILFTPDKTATFSQKEIKEGRQKAILSYIIPFIPYINDSNNRYVKYHAKEGMNLLIVIVGYIILITILPIIIIGLGITILIITIIGIINVLNNKARELPIINRIKIFK